MTQLEPTFVFQQLGFEQIASTPCSKLSSRGHLVSRCNTMVLLVLISVLIAALTLALSLASRSAERSSSLRIVYLYVGATRFFFDATN